MRFKISEVAIGKARPRHRGNISYMPKRYQAWMQRVVDELRGLSSGFSFEDPVCVRMAFLEDGVEVEVLLTSDDRPKYNRRSDIDNMAGAVLDALQRAEILSNDKQVHRLEVWFDDGTSRT